MDALCLPSETHVNTGISDTDLDLRLVRPEKVFLRIFALAAWRGSRSIPSPNAIPHRWRSGRASEVRADGAGPGNGRRHCCLLLGQQRLPNDGFGKEGNRRFAQAIGREYLRLVQAESSEPPHESVSGHRTSDLSQWRSNHDDTSQTRG